MTYITYRRPRELSANGYPIRRMSRKVFWTETRETLLDKMDHEARITRDNLLLRGVWQSTSQSCAVVGPDGHSVAKFVLVEPDDGSLSNPGFSYGLSQQAGVYMFFDDGDYDPLVGFDTGDLGELVPGVIKLLQFNRT